MSNISGLILLATITAGIAWPNNCVVIDDFSTGTVRSALRDANTSDNSTQTGNMLGGVRGTAFRIVNNQFLQPAELDINKPPKSGMPLVTTTGLKSGFRLDLAYGVNTNFVSTPLNYFPTGCDRFRVSFDSASQILNFNILVFYDTPFAHHAQDGINLDPSPYNLPFCVDFLFANFLPGIPNDTADFPGKGIQALDFIFQTGSAVGGNEFAITRLEILDANTAAQKPCAVVAPPLGQ